MDKKKYKYYCKKCKEIEKENRSGVNEQNFLFYEETDHTEHNLKEFPLELREIYTFLLYLNYGGFGDVFLVNHINKPNEMLALKLCEYDQNDISAKEEMEILKKLSHPNIIQYIDSNIIKDKIYIVTEYANYDLNKFHNMNPSNDQIYKALLEISEGLYYLQFEIPKPIMHLDLKMNNILFKDDQAKIIDFGISKQKQKIKFEDETSLNNISPSRFSPPEWPIVSKKTDVWAFGIISHMVFTKIHPFEGKDIEETIQNIKDIKKFKIHEKILVNSPFYVMIKNCLNYSSENRWDMKTVRDFIKENKECFFEDILLLDKTKLIKKPLIFDDKNLTCKTNFTWNPQKKGDFVTLSDSNRKININDEEYKYRSILGNQGFTEGIHYWEVNFSPENTNESKIGVYIKKNDLDCNECFSDFEDGFAYYGMGELRNNDDLEGELYGLPFKGGIVGVFLNMNEGILSFSLDNKYLGIAFVSENLKSNNKNSILPAISMINSGECQLSFKDKIPEFFFKIN